ncbi:hypothetical protein AK812_SmicGene4599 [Symbiodinium microadriaticum]|uniref:PDZ domain-containing protein n=1 Tax=Symbiodinium microadriaticum TaxID=2951 RepID=A0A1Q9EVR7_SYMMI|nr:hypothetical protein AK812_SmicGene4599 [Symbiodinium microadriaticum]
MLCDCCAENEAALEMGIDEKRVSPMDVIESHPGNYVYDVKLKCPLDNLMEALDTADTELTIIGDVRGSVVTDWNENNPPSRQIGMYDRIVKVDGVQCPGTKEVVKLLTDKLASGVPITFQRPQERTVTVERTARLGMNLNYRKGGHSKPWIASIEESATERCLIDQWNKDHPHQKVAVHDRVISVNGQTLSAVETVEKLRTASGTLTIKLVHFEL